MTAWNTDELYLDADGASMNGKIGGIIEEGSWGCDGTNQPRSLPHVKP